MEGFDSPGVFAGLPTKKKASLPKARIVAVLRDEGGTLGAIGSRRSQKPGQSRS